jgi:hypothetical protein
MIVTTGNIHDSQILEPLVEQVIEKVGKPEAVAADAAYKTPAITIYLLTKTKGGQNFLIPTPFCLQTEKVPYKAPSFCV